jgi:type IV fimbrial biogenesis protein FimT
MGVPMRKVCRATSPGGFTVVELMVVVAIVAILAAIALPNFSSSMRSSRVTSQTNDFLTAINLARTEAVARSRSVTICAADTTAGTPASCGTDWSQGWVVIVDTATGASLPDAITTGATGNLLRSWAPTNGVQVTAQGAVPFFRFSRRGDLSQPDAQTILTVKPSDTCTSQQQRQIVVQTMGRATSSRVDCS